MEENENKICVILGPTATGKSKFSIWLAEKIDGEIISADSMQIYKNMDIATDKISKENMHGIKHYMLDFLEIEKEFSVAEYALMAKDALNEIKNKNKKPILVGGTGLYIDALLKGTNFRKSTFNLKLRQQLLEEFFLKGKEYMFEKLKKIDSNYASKLHVNNSKRVLRALEILISTKKNIDENLLKNNKNIKSLKSLKIGLNFKNREILYEKINSRVDFMIKKGLLNEAKTIFSKKVSKTASQAIGYKEFGKYFSNEISLEEAILKLKQNSRNYAKRQITWFKRYNDIHWFFLDEEYMETVKRKILYLVKNFFS